jgi:hypothetical protein
MRHHCNRSERGSGLGSTANWTLRWNPQPISRPHVDPALLKLSSLQRAIESIRFFVLHAEYWISPDGLLREWLRLMLKLTLLIASPTLLLLPLLTLLLWQLAVCSAYLVIIATNLILFPLAALLAIAAVGIVVVVIRALISR